MPPLGRQLPASEGDRLAGKHEHLARRSGSHRWRAVQRFPSLCWAAFHFKSSWRCAAERRGVTFTLRQPRRHVPRGAHWLLPTLAAAGVLELRRRPSDHRAPRGQLSPFLNRHVATFRHTSVRISETSRVLGSDHHLGCGDQRRAGAGGWGRVLVLRRWPAACPAYGIVQRPPARHRLRANGAWARICGSDCSRCPSSSAGRGRRCFVRDVRRHDRGPSAQPWCSQAAHWPWLLDACVKSILCFLAIRDALLLRVGRAGRGARGVLLKRDCNLRSLAICSGIVPILAHGRSRSPARPLHARMAYRLGSQEGAAPAPGTAVRPAAASLPGERDRRAHAAEQLGHHQGAAPAAPLHARRLKRCATAPIPC